MTELLARLSKSRVLAIVRADDARRIAQCIEILVDEGIDTVEVSLTGAGALEAIALARASLGADVTLGAGTVLTDTDARSAIDAGAAYLVTPGLSDGVEEGLRLGVPVLAGALTPTEIGTAVVRGATAVKLFPAWVGGSRYLIDLRAPFPHVPFVPVGGVDTAAAQAFLQAGAVAVGVGRPLLGDAAISGDLAGLRVRARELRAATGGTE